MIKKVLERISLLILVILFIPSTVQAQGKFSNAITNIDLNQSSADIVKVNIYTKNPYTEKVTINKKPDNKYVILLPETDNWMKAKPTTNNVDESIKNIDVKTQASNVSSAKGYTKIVIESKKPIEIVPQTLVVKSRPKQDNIVNVNNISEPVKIVEKATPIAMTQTLAYNKPTPAATSATSAVSSAVSSAPVKTSVQPTKKPIIRPAQKAFVPKNFPVEIVDLPQPKNILDSEYSEDFLLIPAQEEQVKTEEQPKVDVSIISKSLMKDTPKQLTIKSKFHFKPIKPNMKKLLSWEFNLKLLKLAFKAFFIFGSSALLVFFLLKIFAKKKNSIKDSDEDSASTIENEELKKAIEEFEQVEESVEKLEPKPYIKDVDSYRNLDGFKTEDMPDDILKTLDAIEKAKKNSNPLSPGGEDNRLMSYNYNNDKYLFKSPLEELTEDEEKALFEDEDDMKLEDETLTLQYYNSSDEVFIVEDKEPVDEIFIIEDEEDEISSELDTETEDVMEADLIQDQTPETELEPNTKVLESQLEPELEAETESIQRQGEPEPQLQEEPQFDTENLHIKVKFEISDDKGIALLKYHDVTALIGYIGSEISLLKKFEDETVPEELSVRLSEQVNQETQHYIVKVGNYKGLVEVKPLSIRLLLNL